MSFVHPLKVRFEDVDYAQIVFFPRLFGYCHWAFEEFFAQQAGVTYAQLLKDRRIGFPTVHAEADFRSPLRFGDLCRITLDTVKLSKRSITNRYRLDAGEPGRRCAEIEIVTVATHLDTLSPVELPEDVRQAFLKHLIAEVA